MTWKIKELLSPLMKLGSVIILLVMFRIIKYVLNKIIGVKDESKRN